MKWLTDVLERSGVVPSDHLARQILDAIPVDLVTTVVRESAAEVLKVRGIRDAAGDLAQDLALKAAPSVLLALELGDGGEVHYFALEAEAGDLEQRARSGR